MTNYTFVNYKKHQIPDSEGGMAHGRTSFGNGVALYDGAPCRQ